MFCAAVSAAAPLQSLLTLPSTRTTRSTLASATSAAYPPSQPLPSSRALTPGTLTSQPSARLQASASSAAPRSQQYDKLYAAYADPAGKPSARRSLSVGRRSSSDIAASLNRSRDLGVGSLGALAQPLQPLPSAKLAGGTRAMEGPLCTSSRSRIRQDTASSRAQPAQQDAGMHLGARASMHGYHDSVSTSSVAGRSSLIGRRGSQSPVEDEGLSARAPVRAGGAAPSRSDSGSELSSSAPVLSR